MGTGSHAISATYGGGSGHNGSNGSASLTVAPKPVTITPTSGQSKVYGAVDPTLTFSNNGGLVAGRLHGCARSRAGLDVGSYAITLGTLSAGSNYNLSLSTPAVNFTITAKSITGSFTASNKVYDGNASATVLTRTLNGGLLADAVSLDGGTATFGNKNVGANKTVTLIGAVLAGADKDNYSLSSVGTTTADITAKSITGSFTAANKVYDGNISATVLTRSLTVRLLATRSALMVGPRPSGTRTSARARP